jgi:hypothetical protein
MVILHFGGLALLWAGIAAIGLGAEGGVSSSPSANAVRADLFRGHGLAALALHAIAVALLAWKGYRRFFRHGPFAVVIGGLPLVPLLANLWLVPAFLYLIAVLHVGLACRHETLGRLQADRLQAAGEGQT